MRQVTVSVNPSPLTLILGLPNLTFGIKYIKLAVNGDIRRLEAKVPFNQALHSITLQDAKGERTSVPIYMVYDPATATLSSMLAYLATTLGYLDPITDGQIVSHRLTLEVSLPTSGIKTAPVAASDVEETGLFTYLTDAPVKRAFGQDIPAIPDSKVSGSNIIQSDTDVTNWTGRASATGATFRWTNADYLAGLTTVRAAKKTFRKHRRAAKRA